MFGQGRHKNLTAPRHTKKCRVADLQFTEFLDVKRIKYEFLNTNVSLTKEIGS